MATYKVIQDIEAEDKLLGPLSLRQFIYAVIVIVLIVIGFSLAKIQPLLFIPFIPPIVFFGLLAAPVGQDQSSEVWLLAKIRFMFKPRRRLWDQSGLSELVTVTAPKHVERHLTDGLDQSQVKSRLQALASTLDSRGWVVKDAMISETTIPAYTSMAVADDRLIAMPESNLVTETYVSAEDDILDEQNNPTAHHLDDMIVSAEQTRRQQLVANIEQEQKIIKSMVSPGNAPPPDFWFMNQNPSSMPAVTVSPGQDTPVATPLTVPMPVAAADDTGIAEKELLEHAHKENAIKHSSNSRTKRLKTPAEIAEEQKQQALQKAAEARELAMKKQEEEAEQRRKQEILRLSTNNDLTVSTMVDELDNKQPKLFEENDGEVIISLH